MFSLLTETLSRQYILDRIRWRVKIALSVGGVLEAHSFRLTFDLRTWFVTQHDAVTVEREDQSSTQTLHFVAHECFADVAKNSRQHARIISPQSRAF